MQYLLKRFLAAIFQENGGASGMRIREMPQEIADDPASAHSLNQ